jgi:putative aldouronate transport system permease protein
MIATTLAAYPLSRNFFYCRKFFTMICVFTMLFSGGLIPSYLVVKSLGLVNSYGALWLPGLVSTYNMLIMRTFFTNIPSELEEAARIDGCNEVQLLYKIFLPLSLPVIATLSLFYAVGYWNAFMSVLIYIIDTAKFNLSVLVNNMIRNQSLLDPNMIQAEDIVRTTPEGVRAAGIMVMVIPMLVVYPVLQKYFVKGTMLGSVKG